MEVTQDTVVDTGSLAPVADPPAAPAADPAPAADLPGKPVAEQSVSEKLQNLKAAKDAKNAKATKDPDEPVAVDQNDPVAKAAADAAAVARPYSPNTKYKVMDKEHEIPKEFQALMKDAESEKKIREIFERSTGLDVVKENLTSARNDREQARRAYSELNNSVNDLRSTYTAAVKSGDMHKLDLFWKKLEIPQDVILQYALAKVQLNEMPPEHRQALEQKQRAEQESDDIRRQQAEMSKGYLRQHQEVKTLLLESTLRKPETQAAAQDFETRIGKPGSFEAEVRRFGEMEWHRSGGRVDLSPEQAIAAVIQHYGLSLEAKVSAAAPAAVTPAAPAASKDPRQNVIVKPVTTIPNLGSGGSQSPLKSKPKSIEELKELGKRAAAGEAI